LLAYSYFINIAFESYVNDTKPINAATANEYIFILYFNYYIKF